MAGKKRSANGQVKPETVPPPPAKDITMADATPPCGQPQPPSTQSTIPKSQIKPVESLQPVPKAGSAPSSRKRRQKLAKLPPNTTLHKRPILHPSLASPFSNASSPKTLYITASSPFIPAVKRVRKLLAQITLRRKQSAAARGHRGTNSSSNSGGYAEANGRLEARVVESEIVREAAAGNKGKGSGASTGGGEGGEEVYLKATGRAIPRALEIGVYFQGEEDCHVRVEMGSVVAVDDIEVKQGEGAEEEEEVPETRLRTVSSVTVSIGVK